VKSKFDMITVLNQQLMVLSKYCRKLQTLLILQLNKNDSYDLNIKSFVVLNNAVFQRNKCDFQVNYIRDWPLQKNVFDDLHNQIVPAMFFT
jgi:hypothetical protein